MEVIDKGHAYKLKHLDGISHGLLIFVKREGDRYPGNVGSYPGTTCQEVLRALSDRVRYLNNQMPWWGNRIILLCLAIALYLFEFRHARQKGRWIFPWQINSKTCNVCGHNCCKEHVK